MKIAVVTTGDEVLQGVIADRNSSWISERCHTLGHEVIWHFSTRDDEVDIGQALHDACSRADGVIVTGGLGPTIDDLTVAAAAKAFGKKLNLNREVLESIRDCFSRKGHGPNGRDMADSNRKQALIPEGGVILPNTLGTAPGVRVKLGGAEVFFLPGVPAEMKPMFETSVAPWLKAQNHEVMVERIFRCFGLPEATIDQHLKGVELFGTRLSFRVIFPEILLKLVSRGIEKEVAQQAVEKAAQAVRECLGEVIYGEGEFDLPTVVGALLQQKQKRIATAESCTGGLIADLLTNVPGISASFDRGIVCYSNDSKVELLEVQPSTLKRYGAVSAEVAREMALGLRNRSNCDFALAVTGIAGPGGGTSEKPVGTVYIAIVHPDGIEEKTFCFSRGRRLFKELVAWHGLNMLRTRLL